MQVRPFFDFLREHRDGASERELARALNELVGTVERTGKKGKLTYTIEVSPMTNKVVGAQLIVVDSIELKLAKPAREGSLFFVTPESNLSRRDPRQQDLELKTIDVVDTRELKEVARAG
jgi:hypothetical protein